jgi:1-acyl-sn-glycerol-3-phosphate acyltransferase
MSAAFYSFLTNFCKYCLLPAYASIKVSGLENMPLDGPLIIATNHLNDADPGVIATRMPRTIVFMAKIELFKVPGLKQLIESYGAIPVKRNEADLAALRLAAQALQAGKALCIFPEGTRGGVEAKMREAWPGAGLIALRSDAPILPIAITGSQRLGLPKMFLKPFMPRYKVTLTIGTPFKLEKPARINAGAAKEGTRVIMEHIAALLPPSYRGYYGDATAVDSPPVQG